MENNYQINLLDKPQGWGSPPAPLLPRSLRSRMHFSTLPDWVCTELALEPGATMQDLGTSVWTTASGISSRTRAFIINTVKLSLGDIRDVVCVDSIWPVGMRVADIGWTRRTRNALGRSGLLENKSSLTDLTFLDLAVIRGLGIIGSLDFSVCLEYAIDRHEELEVEYAGTAGMEEQSDFLVALRGILSEFWSNQISYEDARFADLLPPGLGTISDRIEDLTLDLDPPDNYDTGLQLLAAVESIRERLAALRLLSLEDALRAFFRTLLKDKSGSRFETMLARFGWNGSCHLTLKQCAEKLGITRERVRQIQMEILARIPEHEILMPQLDAALELLEAHAPVNCVKAGELLHSAGIANGPFDAEELLDAAKLLGKSTSLRCEKIDGERIIFADADAEAVTLVLPHARKLAGKSGASNIFQLQESLAPSGHTLAREKIASVLESCAGSCHLMNGDWFMFLDIPRGRDRLENTLAKMLSVAAPQSLSSLREGARRSFRGRNLSSTQVTPLIVPPLEILHHYVAGSSSYQLTAGGVTSARPLNYREELGEYELVLVEVLRSSPAGVLDRRSLAAGCLERGMNENTFNVYTSYSSVLEHIGTGLWKLRGTEVSPEAVEAVRIANSLRPKERRVLGHEWTKDGKLLLAFRVSDRAGDSSVFGCPAPVRRFLDGNEYECQVVASASSCGKLGVTDQGLIYGCKTFIQRYGLDSNDVILAEFDINQNIVQLSIGYEDPWEDAL